VCRRVFWEGSHWRRMRAVVDAMRALPPGAPDAADTTNG
ncbi:twitching motility protein PilT, partial [Burkholderia sp. Tr-862]